MRRAITPLAALAALALGGCSVNVEGAPCGAPGTTTDCPSGQACGNDGRCSERAAQCLDSGLRCTPGAKRCSAQGEREETCTTSDPCGVWAFVPGNLDCGASGLVCAGGGAPSCACAAFAGPELAADPAGGSPSGSAPFPTGAASPAQCRFGNLGEAIARAGQLAPATVQVHAEPGAEAVFGSATGDGAIAIPGGVTVVAARAPAGATILRAAATHGQALVTIQGTLDGFRIEPGAGDATAIAMSCAASGKPTLTNVVVDGGGVLTAGVDVTGVCGADLSGVAVSNVAGPGLRVQADPSAQVTVSGGGFRGSDSGAQLRSGKVTFGAPNDASRAVEIAANTNDGVVLTGGSVDARFHSSKIHGNGGTGVVIEPIGAGSAIALTGCDVYANGRGAPRSYGPDPGRPVGGVLVATGAVPFTFASNRVYGNTGDQLAFESSSAWSIAPTACGPSSNLFACVAAGEYAVAAVAGGTVDARFTVWPAVPFGAYVSGGVTAPVNSFCNGVAGVPPTPAPCP